MKKKYLSPKIQVISLESPALLLTTSQGKDKDINVDVDGNDKEITDGGTTDPDENYNPW